MNANEKNALENLKEQLEMFPKVLMITVQRKDLELIVKYLENKKATDRRQA